MKGPLRSSSPSVKLLTFLQTLRSSSITVGDTSERRKEPRVTMDGAGDSHVPYTLTVTPSCHTGPKGPVRDTNGVGKEVKGTERSESDWHARPAPRSHTGPLTRYPRSLGPREWA